MGWLEDAGLAIATGGGSLLFSDSGPGKSLADFMEEKIGGALGYGEDVIMGEGTGTTDYVSGQYDVPEATPYNQNYFTAPSTAMNAYYDEYLQNQNRQAPTIQQAAPIDQYRSVTPEAVQVAREQAINPYQVLGAQVPSGVSVTPIQAAQTAAASKPIAPQTVGVQQMYMPGDVQLRPTYAPSTAVIQAANMPTGVTVKGTQAPGMHTVGYEGVAPSANVGPNVDVQIATAPFDQRMGSFDRLGNTVQDARAYEQSALRLAEQAARGETPSAAQLQMQEGMDRAVAAQMALASSATGGTAARLAAQRQAQFNAADIQAQTNRDLATLRAQEMAQARQSFLGGTQALRTTDISSQGLGLDAAQVALQPALAQAQLAQQAGLQGQALGLQAGLQTQQLTADEMQQRRALQAQAASDYSQLLSAQQMQTQQLQTQADLQTQGLSAQEALQRQQLQGDAAMQNALFQQQLGLQGQQLAMQAGLQTQGLTAQEMLQRQQLQTDARMQNALFQQQAGLQTQQLATQANLQNAAMRQQAGLTAQQLGVQAGMQTQALGAEAAFRQQQLQTDAALAAQQMNYAQNMQYQQLATQAAMQNQQLQQQTGLSNAQLATQIAMQQQQLEQGVNIANQNAALATQAQQDAYTAAMLSGTQGAGEAILGANMNYAQLQAAQDLAYAQLGFQAYTAPQAINAQIAMANAQSELAKRAALLQTGGSVLGALI